MGYWQGSVDAVTSLFGTTETKLDNRAVRLEATRLLPKLLREGLGLEGQAFHCAVQGLAGRLEDTDDDVVSVAVESLKELRTISTASYSTACAAPGPVQHARLQKHCLTMEEKRLTAPAEYKNVMNVVNPEQGEDDLLGCRESNDSGAINSDLLNTGDHTISQTSESASEEHLCNEITTQPSLSLKLETNMPQLLSEGNEVTSETRQISTGDEVNNFQPVTSLAVAVKPRPLLVSGGEGDIAREANQSHETTLQQSPPHLTVENGSLLQPEGMKSSSNAANLSDEIILQPPPSLKSAIPESCLVSGVNEPSLTRPSLSRPISSRDSCISSCSLQESNLLTDLLPQCSASDNGKMEIDPLQVKQAIDALDPASDLLPRLPLLLPGLFSAGDLKLDIGVLEAIRSVAERSEASTLLSCVLEGLPSKKEGDIDVGGGTQSVIEKILMLFMHALNDECAELCPYSLHAFTSLVKKVGLGPTEATLRECLQSRSWHVRRGSLRLILAGLCSDNGGGSSEDSRHSARALVTEAARLMNDPSIPVHSALQELLAKSTLCGIFADEGDQKLVVHDKLKEAQRPQTSSEQLGNQLANVNGDCLGNGSHVRRSTAPVNSVSKQDKFKEAQRPQASSGQLGNQLVNGECLGNGSHVRWSTAPVNSVSKKDNLKEAQRPQTSPGQLGNQLVNVNGGCLDNGCNHDSRVRQSTAPVNSVSKQDKLKEAQRPQASSGQLGNQLVNVNGDCLDNGYNHDSHAQRSTAPVNSVSKQDNNVHLIKPQRPSPLGPPNFSSKHKIPNVDNTSIQSEPPMPFWSTYPSFSSMESDDSPRTYTSDPVLDQSKLSMLKKKKLVRARQATQHPYNEKLHKEANIVGSKSPLRLSNIVHNEQGMKDNRAALCLPTANSCCTASGLSGCCETGAPGGAESMPPRSASPTPPTLTAKIDKCQNDVQIETRTWAAVTCRNVTPSPRPNSVPTAAHTAISTTVTNRTDAIDYLNFVDINPSSNPKMELSEVLQGLGKQSWPEIFHLLTSIRRLALHHGHLLEPHVHSIVLGVINQADNLRSQVCKNALLCLGDMWKGMGKVLDPELQEVAPTVIKKFADKVEFIREAAELAIRDIISGGSDRKVIAAFLMCMGPGTPGFKNPHLRARIASSLRMCLVQKGQQLEVTAPKEVKRIVSALGSLLQDSSQETREHSKQIASLLVETGIINESSLRKALPESALSRIKVILRAATAISGKYNYPSSLASTSPPRMVEGNGLLGTVGGITSDDYIRRESYSRTVDATTVNEFIAPNFGNVNENSTSSLQHKAADKGFRKEPATRLHSTALSIRINGSEHGDLTPPSSLSPIKLSKVDGKVGNIKSSTTLRSFDVETLPSLLLRMEGKNWRDRQAAVDELSEMFVAQPEIFSDPFRLGKCMNHIHDRLNDTNAKVCLAAVNVLPLIASSLGNALDPFVSFLVPTICNILGSTSGQLIKGAERALESLTKAVGPSRLLPLVSTKTLSGNTRLRGPLLIILSALVAEAGLEETESTTQSSRITLITRYALPVACRNFKEAKPDIRTANQRLIDALRGVIGPDVDVQIKKELRSSPNRSSKGHNKSTVSPLRVAT